MSRTIKIILIVGMVVVVSLVLLCLAAAAVYLPLRSSGPAPAEVVTVPATPGDIELPNPAAAYCQEQGYTLEIRTNSDGGQYGVCIFSDGSECDEWAFYRGECGPAVPTATATPVGTGETVHIPEIGLAFEVPAGWQRQSDAWVWISGQQRLGVAWGDITPGQEPEPLFLPEGAVMLDRTPGPELSWGTAATYRLQVLAPDGEWQVQAVEIHVIVRGTSKLYDIYASAPDEEQLAALEPVLQALLVSSTLSQ
jgi:putative hemolysin